MSDKQEPIIKAGWACPDSVVVYTGDFPGSACANFRGEHRICGISNESCDAPPVIVLDAATAALVASFLRQHATYGGRLDEIADSMRAELNKAEGK